MYTKTYNMKRCLLLTFITLCTCATFTTNAQWQPGKVVDGFPRDSLIISFGVNDTIVNDTNKFYIERTANDSLWQIGTTQKTFFSAGGFANRGIMTDTTNHYPINANSSFVISIDDIYKYGHNIIIGFKHKYETSSGLDGGLVEFSNDSGKTWNNVKGDCSIDSTMIGQGIILENFYDYNDTLPSGEPAFMGTSNGWVTSRLQFFHGFPIRTTGQGGWQCVKYNVLLRFRFVSDTTADTLDGWIIDDIKMEQDDYGGSASSINKYVQLSIFPNPATSVVNFPTLPQQGNYRLSLYNILGVKVADVPYTNKLDISNYQTGIYYYHVTDGDALYTGKLQIE